MRIFKQWNFGSAEMAATKKLALLVVAFILIF